MRTCVPTGESSSDEQKGVHRCACALWTNPTQEYQQRTYPRSAANGSSVAMRKGRVFAGGESLCEGDEVGMGRIQDRGERGCT